MADDNINIPIDENTEINEHLRQLKPTLEIAESKEGSVVDLKERGDSKFETTFGFSHGVDLSS